LEEQIADLTQTIRINKEMLNEMFTGKDTGKVLAKLNEENNKLLQKLSES
jgi:hypothetical protein